MSQLLKYIWLHVWSGQWSAILVEGFIGTLKYHFSFRTKLWDCDLFVPWGGETTSSVISFKVMRTCHAGSFDGIFDPIMSSNNLIRAQLFCISPYATYLLKLIDIDWGLLFILSNFSRREPIFWRIPHDAPSWHDIGCHKLYMWKTRLLQAVEFPLLCGIWTNVCAGHPMSWRCKDNSNAGSVKSFHEQMSRVVAYNVSVVHSLMLKHICRACTAISWASKKKTRSKPVMANPNTNTF